MALTPAEFPKFPGLDLRDDPQEVGAPAAVDLLNVDLQKPGMVRSRDGYSALGSAASTRYTAVFPFTLEGGTSYLLAARAGSPTTTKLIIDAIDSSGTVVATKTITTTQTPSTPTFVRLGTPSVQRAYICTYNGPLCFFDGNATFTDASGSPPVGFVVGAQPLDNRLVIANQASATSRVQFSNAGNADTWGANNFVELTPGDGDSITAMASWQNFLFVFKRRKFFVFYGNSVDGSGNPVFNYRTVDGVGVSDPRAVATGPDGVYIANARGVYRTTGGQPQLLSQALDPFFLGGTSSYWQGGTLDTTSTECALAYSDDVVYAAFTGTGGKRTFVLTDNRWSCWDIPAGDLASFPVSGKNYLVFPYSSGTNKVGRVNSSATTDDGTSITSRYRTGFWNPGQPAAESVVREWLLDGYGTPTLKSAVNDGSLGTGATVTLGTSPAIAQGRDRRATRGRNVSFEVSGTSAWSMSRLVANLRGQRNPGLKAT